MLPELEPKSVANEPKSHNQFKTYTTNLSYHQVYKCNIVAWKPGLSSAGERQGVWGSSRSAVPCVSRAPAPQLPTSLALTTL